MKRSLPASKRHPTVSGTSNLFSTAVKRLQPNPKSASSNVVCFQRSYDVERKFAAQVGERFDIFDVSSAEVDKWFRLRVATVNGEDFGFRLADVKVPGLGEVVKIGHGAVETFGRVANHGHVIGIEEDLDKFGEFVRRGCSLLSTVY
jgi:hypothetical protein